MIRPLSPSATTTTGPRSRCAFSLVEVVLAIGIVAFAFMAIIGLLPTGLTTFQTAMDTSVTAQIVQRVAGEAHETDFDKLPAFAGTQWHFDDQGTKLDDGASPRKVYDVNVVIERNPADNSIESALPGVRTPSLATLTVQIATNPGNKPLGSGVWTSEPGITVRNYPVYVAKNL